MSETSTEETHVFPTVTVDAVTVRNNDGQVEFLIHKRPREPYKDSFAIPGVYMRAGETIVEATARVLQDKVGISAPYFTKTINVADSTARDPRGHAISIITLSFVTMAESLASEQGEWTPVHEVESKELAFDHTEIIREVYAIMQRQLLTESYILRGLTFDQGPLSTASIMSAFRALGDKDGISNIRRRVRVSGIAKELGEFVEPQGRGRPSKRWEFV